MAIIKPEARIQQDIVTDFNNRYCLKHHNPRFLIYSIPNGIPVSLPIKIMSRALDLLNKTGMLKGASDLEIRTDKLTINVEVKAEFGIQSTDQIDFEKRIKQLGGIYLVVRSLEDFNKQIERYL